MHRAPRSRSGALPCAAAAMLALALTGCVWPGGAPDRTDPNASAAPAEAIADAVGPAAECRESVFWGGEPEGAIPATADYRAGFLLPDAIEGFDVLCSASWTFPQNECQMQFAHAYLDGGEQGARLDEIDSSMVAWATERGLEQTRIGKADNTRSYGIEVDADPEMGNAVMTQLSWDAVSRYDGEAGVQRHADLAGIPLDGGDVLVTWQVCPALQGWESPPAP